MKVADMNPFWSGRPCLVTGGAGFGGSHLCEHLLNLGALVYVLDRWLSTNSYLVLTDMISKVNYIQGDIRDMDLLRLTLERFEINTVFILQRSLSFLSATSFHRRPSASTLKAHIQSWKL